MIVELLTFDGCPNASTARERVEAALREEGAAAQLAFVDVSTPREAIARQFLGSPSVRIDGLDVEPEARTRDDYGLVCRVYRQGGLTEGAPSVARIREAIRSSQNGEVEHL